MKVLFAGIRNVTFYTYCCNGAPIFRSSPRVSLLWFPFQTPTMQHALSSSCVLFVSRVVWIVLLLSQIEWWNKSCRLHRNTKRDCGSVKTYRGSHSDVGCWKMTVIRKGFPWCTFPVNNHSRKRGDLWRLFSAKTTAGKTTNSTYNTHHLWVRFGAIFLLITYHVQYSSSSG